MCRKKKTNINFTAKPGTDTPQSAGSRILIYPIILCSKFLRKILPYFNKLRMQKLTTISRPIVW